MSLVTAVVAKQKSIGITSKIALASAIGVSIPTIYSLLSGKKVRPHARTLHAYARFLRISATKVATLAGYAEVLTRPGATAGARTGRRAGKR